MAEYDLTSRISEFFDRHLVFPLLEFLSDRELFSDQDILKAKLDLLSNTNMVDYMMEVYANLNNISVDDVPEDMRRKRDNVVTQLREMQAQTEPIAKILEQDQVAEQLQNTRDREGKQLLEFLMKNYDFHPDMLDMLYSYAKFKYECGDYSAAAEYLYYYRILVSPTSKNYIHSLWGKLASEILVQNWDAAREDLNKLRTHIDNTSFDTELDVLQQRAWLIHWSLFVFFNHSKGKDDIIDLFLHQASYLNTIQILCPHILRYITTAVVTNKKRRQSLKDLVKVIQLESNNYRDPVLEFVECLYVHYDFDGAQKKLKECEEVLSNDFFLVACLDEFIDSARLLIFEMFCRIHQTISISNLAEKLNMEISDAERWIVNLIRNARLDAKIDSKLGHVTMGSKAPGIHEQVMEHTKMLSFRAQSLAHQLEKLSVEKQGAHWQGAQGY